MSKATMFWMILAAALLWAMTGCETDTSDDDDAADDDAADDDAADDDTEPTEECNTINLSPLGDNGTYYTGEEHTRHSFDFEENVHHLIATLTWDVAVGATFGLDVGEGTCPDNGTNWETVEGDTGEVVMNLYAAENDFVDDEFFPETAGFVHVNLLNDAEYEPGVAIDYSVVMEFCNPL